eukprot:scaffold3197_cov105-Isochrysis_galbana.AAC.4
MASRPLRLSIEEDEHHRMMDRMSPSSAISISRVRHRGRRVGPSVEVPTPSHAIVPLYHSAW